MKKSDELEFYQKRKSYNDPHYWLQTAKKIMRSSSELQSMKKNVQPLTEYHNAELVRNGADFEYKKPSDDFIAMLDEALFFMGIKKISNSIYVKDETKDIYLNTFDGAWLFDAPKIGETSDYRQKGMFCFAPFTDLQVDPGMFPNLNMKIMTFNDDISLMKLRHLAPDEKASILVKDRYVTESTQAKFDFKNEKWFAQRDGYTYGGLSGIKELMEYTEESTAPEDMENLIKYYTGKRFVVPVPTCLGKHFAVYEDFIKSITHKEGEMFHAVNLVNVSYQVALAAYYEWFVYIRQDEKSIGIKIPILPEASKEVFSLRQVSESGKRKAICNFVGQHYRTIKSAYNENQRETLVKQHLRGETKFHWNGMEVNIIPAAYDIKRVQSKKQFLNI